MNHAITQQKQLTPTMVTLKILWNFLGIPSVLLGFVLNLDNIKGGIIAVLGILYLSVQLCFFIDKQMDIRRVRKINRWREEQKARGEGWK